MKYWISITVSSNGSRFQERKSLYEAFPIAMLKGLHTSINTCSLNSKKFQWRTLSWIITAAIYILVKNCATIAVVFRISKRHLYGSCFFSARISFVISLASFVLVSL